MQIAALDLCFKSTTKHSLNRLTFILTCHSPEIDKKLSTSSTGVCNVYKC